MRSVPPVDRRDAADHPHRRALAGAVRAEEAERLAPLDVEVDPVDGGEVCRTASSARAHGSAPRLRSCSEPSGDGRYSLTGVARSSASASSSSSCSSAKTISTRPLPTLAWKPVSRSSVVAHARGERRIDRRRADARLLLRAGPLRALLGDADGEALLHDLAREAAAALVVGHREHGARVPFRELAALDHAEHVVRQLEQADAVRHRRLRTADALGDLAERERRTRR